MFHNTTNILKLVSFLKIKIMSLSIVVTSAIFWVLGIDSETVEQTCDAVEQTCQAVENVGETLCEGTNSSYDADYYHVATVHGPLSKVVTRQPTNSKV